VRSPAEHRASIESYLEQIPEIDRGSLREPLRYALDGGGKRLRPVLCLAVAEAAGAPPQPAVPAAAAIELVHTFSLVHDDLPALDDDAERRGRPSLHVQFGEATAILTGDALLGHAFRVVLDYEPQLAKQLGNELAGAAANMIQGQHMELSGETDLELLHGLKTGALFVAAAGCGLHVAGVSAEDEQRSYREFAREFGLLFQLADDIADGDGAVRALGADGVLELAAKREEQARAALDEIDADTSVLAELLSGLSARAEAR
jgi:geranylgeranyl diphosphate synthase type II